MDLGEKLRSERKKFGLTQREMAARIGFSHAAISNVERGRIKNLSKNLAVLLKDTYGFEADLNETSETAGFKLEDFIRKNNLSSKEIEVLFLYMALDKDVRQQVLLEFAISVARHSNQREKNNVNKRIEFFDDSAKFGD